MRAKKLDLDKINQLADESLAKTEAQQPHVNLITSWLTWRTNENNFGNDFELSLNTSRAEGLE